MNSIIHQSSKRIREARTKANVTQVELALEVGRSQPWVCYVETGHLKLSQEQDKALFEAIHRVAERKRATMAAITQAVKKEIFY